MALYLYKQFYGMQIFNPFEYISRKNRIELKEFFCLLRFIYLVHLGIRHPVIWPFINIVNLFHNPFHLFVCLFVCFKGRIDPLPDELNPYLQSSPRY